MRHRNRRGHRRGYRLTAIWLWFAILAPATAAAFEPMAGCFVADAACPAFSSIRHATNPGAIATEPGRAYPLFGANQKDRPSHVQIRIPEADPSDRWVAAGCGHADPACAAARPVTASGPDFVLAASWQPAFCEGHRRTPECRSQTARRFDAFNLALHGLWPEPEGNAWCGVDRSLRARAEAGRWHDLPPVPLSERARAELDTVMPGTRSDLDRHEWLKHGTCSGLTPEAYFRAALALVGELNASPVRALVAARIGARLRAAELRAAFDQAFGAGAGGRVELVCEDGLITELHLHLRGPPAPPAQLAGLLAAAPLVPAGCAGGRVDPAGLDP